MKKATVLILTTLLLYSIVREMNFIKVSLIFTGLAAAYLICRIPDRYIFVMKYPFIISQFIITSLFLVFPHLHIKECLDFFVAFIAFYSIVFYLVTIKESQKGLFKEVVAISILYFSAFFNLLMVGRPVLIISIALPLMLYLFIIGHNKVIFLVLGYTFCIIVALVVKKIPITGAGINFSSDIQRYILLSSPLLLLIWSFIGFVKNTDFLRIISFLGLLGICIDILMVVGLRLSSSIVYQPVTAVLILAPIAGMMMKT
ncbi:MAG: hypothetical protein N3D15_00595 [Syntrophorhabdaceae bacterium]|nr:hypothetical protein [Syntrophorhabdaceae bacterium]